MITSRESSASKNIRVKPRNFEMPHKFDIDDIRNASFGDILKSHGIEGQFNFKESNKHWDFSKKDVASSLPEYALW